MDLLLVEQQVKDLIVLKPGLSSNEKTKRIMKTLSFINEIYDKHHEEIPADEAYSMLFGDEEDPSLGPHKIISNEAFDRLTVDIGDDNGIS